jgi:hypothetical protein
MFPSATQIKDSEGNVLVTSYAVRRPDGNWSLMLVNRDHDHPHPVRVAFEGSAGVDKKSFAGPVRVVTFGSEQYVWKEQGPQSYADPDGPPVGTTVSGGPEAIFNLPKASITVLRGKLDGVADM